MYEVPILDLNRMLKCPNCQESVEPLNVLENSSVSWPNQGWISFRCPVCKRSCHVHVKNNYMALGDIDGAPGPCFMESSQDTIAGLQVSISESSIECKLKTHTFTFPAR